MKVGDRVQIPVWTDRWMMGDRYGTIVKIVEAKRSGSKFGDKADVLLDKSGRVFKCHTKDLEVV